MKVVSNIIGKGLLIRKTMREKELDNANQGETPNGGRRSIVAKDLDQPKVTKIKLSKRAKSQQVEKV